MQAFVAAGGTGETRRSESLVVALLWVIAAILLIAPATHAMTLAVVTKHVTAGAGTFVSHEINLTGPFEPGGSDELEAVLEKLKARGGTKPGDSLATLSLDSKGGALEEGMRVGRLLRQFGVSTIVRNGKRCLSSCAIAFLGGATRGTAGPVADRQLEIGGRLGFHAFYAPRDGDARDAATSRARGVTEGRATSAIVVAYVLEMGLDPEPIIRALVRPPEEMTYIETAGEFMELGICPVALKLPRMTLAERASNICNNASQGRLPAWPDLVNEYTPQEAKRLLLGEIAYQAGRANVRGGIAARLQQVLRGGRGTDALYAELAAAGLPLPVMRAKAYYFEMPVAGIRKMACMATLTPDDPAQYGVVLITHTGLAKPKQSTPAECPELFLFGHDEVIN
ncbi:hypothetical protein [Reyranella sp.]|uniref:COG3904 family protein n=1 Tax=Reyranella sp. TaxID=1929291 RepID=UPI003BA9F3DC